MHPPALEVDFPRPAGGATHLPQAAADLLAEQTSTARACALLGKPRDSHYRDRQPVPLVPAQRGPRASPPNALSVDEQDRIIEALTGPRFCDKSVAQTWATLLDEGVYLASISTMHRLLRLTGTSGGRRNQRLTRRGLGRS